MDQKREVTCDPCDTSWTTNTLFYQNIYDGDYVTSKSDGVADRARQSLNITVYGEDFGYGTKDQIKRLGSTALDSLFDLLTRFFTNEGIIIKLLAIWGAEYLSVRNKSCRRQTIMLTIANALEHETDKGSEGVMTTLVCRFILSVSLWSEWYLSDSNDSRHVWSAQRPRACARCHAFNFIQRRVMIYPRS